MTQYLSLGIVLAALLTVSTQAVPAERVEMGELVLEEIPEIPSALRERLRQYDNTRSAYFLDWMPGGEGILVTTRFGETSQLHLVEQPMGMRRQVTFHEDPVSNGAFPNIENATQILFTKSEKGTEKDQIWLHDLSTGRSEMLTDGESVNRGALWSNTSTRFAFNSTRRNGSDWDVMIQDAADTTKSAKTVFEADGLWYPLDWSADDSLLLVGKYVSINESVLEVVTLETGERRPVGDIGTEEPVAHLNALFNREGTGVFYTSDSGTEFQTLRYFDLEQGASKELMLDVPWDITSLALSNDGRFLAVVTNENSISKMRLLNTRTLEVQEIDIPQSIVASMDFNDDDTSIAMSLYRSVSAGDVIVRDLVTGESVQWTQSEVGGLPAETFRDVRLFEYPTFDETEAGRQRQIPGFMVLPRGEGPFPVLIDIHGGPESQARPYFSSFDQFMANELGVATISPNVRGSSGYGKSYLKLDNGRLREDSVKDIGALLDWIALQPYLAENRVMVFGGSYGGYMVLASMAHYSDRLAGGVNIVGISNFVTFLESTREYRRDLRRHEYGDERDPEMRDFLNSISPTTLAPQIAKPLFVVQGYNDPRVPYTEAEQIVNVVRKNNIPVWYMLAMNEGHGFRQKENRDEFRATAALFIQKHLLGE